jgi:hypothetical protein
MSLVATATDHSIVGGTVMKFLAILDAESGEQVTRRFEADDFEGAGGMAEREAEILRAQTGHGYWVRKVKLAPGAVADNG